MEKRLVMCQCWAVTRLKKAVIIQDAERGRPADALIPNTKSKAPPNTGDDDDDPDDPNQTIPLTRYNAMLAVLRNTLYMYVVDLYSFLLLFTWAFRHRYGGIYERGSREYTLDDFYALQVDKMDRYICLKENNLVLPAEGEDVSSSSESEDDSDDEDSEEDEERPDESHKEETEEGVVVEQEQTEEEKVRQYFLQDSMVAPDDGGPKDALRSQAATFMGVAKDATRSPEDVLSTPLPGENLAMFYARSRTFSYPHTHTQAAILNDVNRRVLGWEGALEQ